MILAGRSRLRRLLRRLTVATAVWVSALPFVLLLVVPRVGIGPAILIAMGLLGGISFLTCESVTGGTGKEEPNQ